MKLQLIRNATLRLNYAGHELLIDPMFAPRHAMPAFAGLEQNPTAELPMPPESVLAGVEFTVISHLHPDHFDPFAQALLPKDMPILCQPGDGGTIQGFGFENVTELTNEFVWQGIHFQRTHGEHGSGEMLPQMGAAMGFFLRARGEPSVYWLGDTVLIPEVLENIRRFQPDVIVTHSAGAALGGTLLILDDVQTVEIARSAPQATVIATHMESLDHCTVSRQELRETAERAGISARKLLIPADGEAISLP